MKKLVLFLSFFSGVLVACKKDPPPEKQFYFIDNEFKDYSIFKPGSWWIYEKDTSSAEDSVYVTRNEFSLHDSATYSWQRSLMEYVSSLTGDTITSVSDLIKSTSTYYSKQKRDSVNEEVLDFFSLKPEGYILELSPVLRMRYNDVKDTTLNGTAYTGVKIFENLGAPVDTLLPKELWYAKNIGVIRKVLFNGEVWYLTRYGIVQ